jgi:hypothetical protein
MGVLTDYFVARDDQDAARAHAATAGPKELGFVNGTTRSSGSRHTLTSHRLLRALTKTSTGVPCDG